jgi:hypothetical protein
MSAQDLKNRVISVFDRLFAEPPFVDTQDLLDGESLELISGKSYSELVPLLSNELDVFPLFDSISQEAGLYYLASSLIRLLDDLKSVEVCENPESLWMQQYYCLTGLCYPSMMGFLKREETIEWAMGNEELRVLLCDVFITAEELLASGLDESDVEEIHQIVSLFERSSA